MRPNVSVRQVVLIAAVVAGFSCAQPKAPATEVSAVGWEVTATETVPAPTAHVPVHSTGSPTPPSDPTTRANGRTELSPATSFGKPAPSYPAPLAIPTLQQGPTVDWQQAVQLFGEAYALQMSGRLEEALEVYRRSIRSFPTAEAYTFLGWTHAWRGQYEVAIAEAKKAIQVDPDLGNPYNDIGAYLMSLGELDEAIPWLQRATRAKRYESPDFPHMNLGEIWVRMGLWSDAFAEFERALRLVPDQALPPLAALEMPLIPVSSQTPSPEGDRRLQQVTRAITDYFQAWNAYDPVALLEGSAPPTLKAAESLLVHLASAKLRQSRTEILGTETAYLDEGLAVLKVQMQVDQQTLLAPYLLVQDGKTWKVVGPIGGQPLDEQSDAPLNRLMTWPNEEGSSRSPRSGAYTWPATSLAGV